MIDINDMFKSDNKAETEINLDNLESHGKIDTRLSQRQGNLQYKDSLYTQYHDLKSGKGLNLFQDIKSNRIGMIFVSILAFFFINS